MEEMKYYVVYPNYSTKLKCDMWRFVQFLFRGVKKNKEKSCLDYKMQSRKL